MKKIFIFTLLLTLSDAEIFKEYFKNNVLKSEIEYVKGTRTDTKEGTKEGEERIYYNSGQLAYTVHNTEGKRNGTLIWYDREQHRLESIDYKMGKRDGQSHIYYADGTLRAEVSYTDDKKEGKEKEYFSTGKLASSVQYTQGKKEGLQTDYYESGQIKNKVTYKNNYKEGFKTSYDKNGTILQNLEYKMGRPVETMKSIQEKKPDATIEAFKKMNFNPQHKKLN